MRISIKLNKEKNAIMICENLIKTKGFENTKDFRVKTREFGYNFSGAGFPSWTRGY